jgi:hypothetical protein
MRPGISTDLNALVVWVSGDTWNGLPSVTIQNPLAPGNLDSVKMAFKVSPQNGAPALELTSANGDITITDAANWVFTVNPGRYELPVGKYIWQVETADDSSPAYIQTILEGTAEVLNNVTTIT